MRVSKVRSQRAGTLAQADWPDYLCVVLFEVVDDIVTFGQSVDAVVLVDEHRHASLSTYFLDFRAFAPRARDCAGFVFEVEFIEFGRDFGTVGTAGQFVQDEI